MLLLWSKAFTTPLLKNQGGNYVTYATRPWSVSPPLFFGEIRLAKNAYHSFFEYISSCGPCHETDETNIAQFRINMGKISMKRFGCKQAAYRSSIWDACVWLLLLGPPPTEIWLSSKRKLYLLALYLLLVLLVYSKIWNGKPVSQNEKKTQLNYHSSVLSDFNVQLHKLLDIFPMFQLFALNYLSNYIQFLSRR